MYLKLNLKKNIEIKSIVIGQSTILQKNEDLLALQDNPINYNKTIIWKDKFEISKMYIKDWSFYLDLKYILQSIFIK